MPTFKTSDGQEITVPDDATVTIRVDGKDQEMTVGSIATNATKAAGADAKFREAAEMRTSADAEKAQARAAIDAIQLLSQSHQSGTPLNNTQWNQISAAMEYSEEESASTWTEYQQLLSGGEETETSMVNPQQSIQLPPDVLQKLQKLDNIEKQLGVQGDFLRGIAGEGIDTDIKNLLQSDEFVGKLNGGQQNIAAGLVRSAVRDFINETGQDYGPAALAHARDKVKETFTGLGIETDSAKQTRALQDRLQKVTAAGVAGLGPSGESTVSTDIQIDKPIKMPSAVDATAFDDAWVQDTMRHHAQEEFNESK